MQHEAEASGDARAELLAEALDKANARFLETNKSPSRKVGELDNRGSHFYLAMYWAEALAEQDDDAEMKKVFGELAKTLADNEAKIVGELNAVQGSAVDMGGYYHADLQRARQIAPRC